MRIPYHTSHRLATAELCASHGTIAAGLQRVRFVTATKDVSVLHLCTSVLRVYHTVCDSMFIRVQYVITGV